MIIRLVSDTHHEFHKDGGRTFVKSLDPRGVDLLVLAGDITNMQAGIEKSLRLFREHFSCPVVVVNGNHEFYYSDRRTVIRTFKDAAAKLQGVHFLDCNIVEIDGYRILGTPLWYSRSKPKPPMLSTEQEWDNGVIRAYYPEVGGVVTSLWPDFECIEKFASWVYKENARAIKFFEDNLREGDIVITHMLPSALCISSRFERSPKNNFFVTELRPLIEERKPALWMYGHSHDSIDVTIGSTRVVNNPFGYVPNEINPKFRPDFTLEVSPLTTAKAAGTTGT